MRQRVAAIAVLVVMAYGCRTTAPVVAPAPEPMHGVASWYGEEFAGRTTANGEIFDPSGMTAAHRSLPFGTVLDVTNTKTHQTVRVRVNDRGPYIGGRILDLSYAAAQQISLIEPGIGDVVITVVHVGNGEREPPVPFEATVAEAPKVVPIIPAPASPVVDAPKVEPLPPVVAAPSTEPVVVDRIEVETEHAGVITRTQVAADGRTLEEVAVADNGETKPIARVKPVPQTQPKPAKATPVTVLKRFVVQVGAFAVEANAKLLQERLNAIGQRAWIDRNDLYRVRLGPFATRDAAAEARATLEANGLSAIIVIE